MTDRLEQAIEAGRDQTRPVPPEMNVHALWRSAVKALVEIHAAWDATREVREAEADLVEACVATGQTRLGDSDWVRRALAHVERLRELSKPRPRYIISKTDMVPVPGAIDVVTGMEWVASFRNKSDAEAWAAAREVQP